MFSQTAGGGGYWRWDFAFEKGPSDVTAHGHCESLEDAKAAVERIWQMWLTAAGLDEA
jgi:hypothetical protein